MIAVVHGNIVLPIRRWRIEMHVPFRNMRRTSIIQGKPCTKCSLAPLSCPCKWHWQDGEHSTKRPLGRKSIWTRTAKISVRPRCSLRALGLRTNRRYLKCNNFRFGQDRKRLAMYVQADLGQLVAIKRATLPWLSLHERVVGGCWVVSWQQPSAVTSLHKSNRTSAMIYFVLQNVTTPLIDQAFVSDEVAETFCRLL